MSTATLNGLTIGSGTPYTWRAWPTGLGTPDIRTDDRTRPRRAGVVAADDLLGARTIDFEVQVLGDRPYVEQALTDLAEAFAPSSADVWLTLNVSGAPATYSMRGRARGCEWDLTRRFTLRLGDAKCTFVATDPVKYGDETSVTIGLGSGGAGFVLPATLPGVLGGGSTSGIGSVPNAGSTPVEWTCDITGPVTNPRIEHIESGRFLQLATTLAAGQTLTLDSGTGAVLFGGTAPRPSWLASGSRWFTLAPGSNSIRFVADLGTGTAIVTYRPGWA